MSTVTLTTTPTILDAGTAYDLSLVNSGSLSIHVEISGGSLGLLYHEILRPKQQVTVYPHGYPVSAFTDSGTSSVDVTIGDNPQLNATREATQDALAAGALVKTANLSDLANPGTARSNLGLGTAATHPDTDFLTPSAASATYQPVDHTWAAGLVVKAGRIVEHSGSLYKVNADMTLPGTFDTIGLTSVGGGSGGLLPANNLSDLTSAPTARTNLGLGTAAVVDTGTASGNVPVLDGTGNLGVGVLNNVGKYDKRTNLYNVQASGLRKFRAALAKAEAGTGLCDIVMCGTSISAGTGSTRTTSWPEYVRALLTLKGYPIGGTGIMAAAGNPADPRVTMGAGWTAFSSTQILAGGATGGGTLTFAADVAGTIVDVYTWEGGGAGPIAWTIDGVAQTAITVGTDQTVKKTTVTGLSNATHTVVLTHSGTGTSYVVGVDVHKTSGVKVTNFGEGGALSLNVGSTQTQAWSVFQMAKTMLPGALVFLEYGANDTDRAAFDTNMAYGVAQLSAVSDVALVAYAARGGDTDSTTTGAPSIAASGQVALRALSDTYGVPVVDIFDRWGLYSSWGTALGMAADVIHPNEVGARDFARCAAGLLGI